MKNIYLVLVAVLLSACVAHNPATGRNDFTLISDKEAYNRGHQTAAEAIAEIGLYKEQTKFTEYYRDLGKRAVMVSETPDMPVEFILLDTPEYNAWATPGYVNFNRGILPFFNSEAQFVTVLGHELGHITARHTHQRYTNAVLAQLGVAAAGILVATQTDNQSTQRIAGTVAAVAGTVALAGFSRADEAQADGLAQRYMSRMGYDPRLAASTFEGMHLFQEQHKKVYALFNNGEVPTEPPFYHFLLSHPESEKRRDLAQEQAGALDDPPPLGQKHEADYSATPAGDPAGQARYYKLIDGVAYGPQPKYGIAGKDYMYFPDRRFAFPLPKGYYMDFQGDKKLEMTWRGISPGISQTIVYGVTKAKRKTDSESFLRSAFPKARQIEDVPLNDNFVATTGVREEYAGGMFGKKELKYLQRIVVLPATLDAAPGDDVAKFHVLGFEAPAEVFEERDKEFKQLLRRAQRLSKAKADQLQPLRLKIHTVKRGETVASLSKKMAFGGLQEEWLRTLNQLPGGQEVKPGQLIKLIVDPNRDLPFIK